MYKHETCSTCAGDGRVEICNECAQPCEDCTCTHEDAPPSTEVECNECHGDGCVEVD